MAPMANISALLNDLQKTHWHITAFPFHFKKVNYIVIFEDIANLPLVAGKYLVLLTFIDKSDENRKLQVKANDYGFEFNVKQFRKYFGIQYSPNLGDIFKQFYAYFGQFVPESRVIHLDTETQQAVIKQLSHNDRDNSNAQCCYKVIHNGIYNGVQHRRTPFNSDKTKLLRPSLYETLGGDDTLSFCYRENNSLTDIEIYEQFMRNYGTGKL